jgi:hypothetical protein
MTTDTNGWFICLEAYPRTGIGQIDAHLVWVMQPILLVVPDHLLAS